MTMFYAQPYDLAATGFYFEEIEMFEKKIGSIKNDYGETVEESEIQFIDGEAIDAALCDAIGVYQGTVAQVFELIDTLHEYDKQCLIITCGECGHSFDPRNDSVTDYEIDIYDVGTLRDLAEYFVGEELYGEIPDSLQIYIDYDAIARDLAVDFTETEIAGQRLIHACPYA